MPAIPDLRPSPIAGTWYTANPGRLSAEIDGYMASASIPALDGAVVGVIAPHAGFRYSGPVAGYAFKAVQGLSFDMAAVLSPMHHVYPQALLTSAHRAYSTPLGRVEVDCPAVEKLNLLLEPYGQRVEQVAEDPEHSLEIELPFLQRALAGPFSLLPVMMRSQNPRLIQQVGLALAEVVKDRNCLLVASTDLSHFHPQKNAERLDQNVLAQVEAFSPEGLIQAVLDRSGEACGFNAAAAVMWAARSLGADRAVVLNHATSGDVTGDYSSVVGYGAAVLLKPA